MWLMLARFFLHLELDAHHTLDELQKGKERDVRYHH